MKFKIITLGCKVNAYESEFMLEELKRSGYLYDEDNPDIVIINTCSVTNMADRKSRKMVHQVKRKYPKAILVVVGCSSQNHQEDYQNMGIDILLGNRGKSKISTIISDYLNNHEAFCYFTKERNLDFEDMKIEKFTTHTRAFIKIQDGCNNFCSYCIIPYVRGSIRSKDFNQVLEECKTLVAHGHQEIVLTGIHTGSYSSDGHDLSDLIKAMAKIPGLVRIRISSIEITELNDKFLNLLKSEEKIANHLHIPLQSGSDVVLKRMNRKYDTTYFKDKIAQIRRIRPDISITTDCIVGHPYESDACFLEYVRFCKEVNFSRLHVFPYSIRSKTPSSLMPQIDEQTKKIRVQELLKVSKELEEAYEKKFLNQSLEVIAEIWEEGYTVGITSNYLKVYIKGKYPLNQRYMCKITKIDDHVYGDLDACLNEEIRL